MSKRIKNILTAVSLVLSAALIITGIVLLAKRDKTKGNFFRRMYGSVGFLDNSESSLSIELFNFGNEDISFLDEPEKLSFDNPKIKLIKLSYEPEHEEKNLRIYQVNFDLRTESGGDFRLTTLRYAGDKEQEFPLGDLHFLVLNQTNQFMPFGAESNFIESEVKYSFPVDCEKAYTINGILTAEDDETQYSFPQNFKVKPEKESDYLDYSVKIQRPSDMKPFDVFLFRPIFEAQYEGESGKFYFVPLINSIDAEDMSYEQIKGYIK